MSLFPKNMQDFKINFKSILYLLGFLSIYLGSSCTKEINETIKNGNTVYQLDTVALYQTGAEKIRIKTSAQFVGILYSDLFGKGISPKELNEISFLSLSIGDKSLYSKLILENYLSISSTHPNLIVPNNQEMRNDLDKFIRETYLRFYARIPSKLEVLKLKQIISGDPLITPQLVFKSFCLSTEYKYY